MLRLRAGPRTTRGGPARPMGTPPAGPAGPFPGASGPGPWLHARSLPATTTFRQRALLPPGARTSRAPDRLGLPGVALRSAPPLPHRREPRLPSRNPPLRRLGGRREGDPAGNVPTFLWNPASPRRVGRVRRPLRVPDQPLRSLTRPDAPGAHMWPAAPGTGAPSGQASCAASRGTPRAEGGWPSSGARSTPNTGERPVPSRGKSGRLEVFTRAQDEQLGHRTWRRAREHDRATGPAASAGARSERRDRTPAGPPKRPSRAPRQGWKNAWRRATPTLRWPGATGAVAAPRAG